MFHYKIKYQKGATDIEADMISQSPVSENLSQHVYRLDLNEIIKILNKENVTADGKKYIEINDVTVIKKKVLFKIVVPMSSRLSLLEKNPQPNWTPRNL